MKPTVSYDNIHLAILAMDTYHRRINSGLKNLSEAGLNNVGGARVILDSEANNSELEGSIGFYAVKYQTDGETIYGYRGTDRGFTNFGV